MSLINLAILPDYPWNVALIAGVAILIGMVVLVALAIRLRRKCSVPR